MCIVLIILFILNVLNESVPEKDSWSFGSACAPFHLTLDHWLLLVTFLLELIVTPNILFVINERLLNHE